METVIKCQTNNCVLETQNKRQRGFTAGSSPMNSALPIEESYRESKDNNAILHLVLLDADADASHPSKGTLFGSRDPSVTLHPVAMLLPNVFYKSQCLKKYQLFISDIPVLLKKPFEIQRYLCDVIKTFHFIVFLRKTFEIQRYLCNVIKTFHFLLKNNEKKRQKKKMKKKKKERKKYGKKSTGEKVRGKKYGKKVRGKVRGKSTGKKYREKYEGKSGHAMNILPKKRRETPTSGWACAHPR